MFILHQNYVALLGRRIGTGTSEGEEAGATLSVGLEHWESVVSWGDKAGAGAGGGSHLGMC